MTAAISSHLHGPHHPGHSEKGNYSVFLTPLQQKINRKKHQTPKSMIRHVLPG